MYLKDVADLLATLIVVSACGEVGPRSTGPESRGSEAVLDLRSEDEAANIALARNLARALSQAEIRSAVLNALRRSPVVEDKVHFASFLGDPGASIRADMVEAAGSAPQTVERWLGESTPLELYLPVPEHRIA